jgi:hypothetical protein
MKDGTTAVPDDVWTGVSAREKWRGVRIEEAQLAPAAGSEHAMRVWACVELGELAPADVRVELVPGAPGTILDRSTHRAHRLWSVQSYFNGRYVFEGIVPAPDLAGPEGYSIRITRYADVAAARTAPAVVRWFGGVTTSRRATASHR